MAYSPPDHAAANIQFVGSYSPPSGAAADIQFSESEAITGTGAGTLDGLSLAAIGWLPVTGDSAGTLDGAGLSSAGMAWYPIAGTLTSTLDGASLTSAGTFLFPISGAGTGTLDGLSLSADGYLAPAGPLFGFLDGLVATAAGISPIFATASGTLDGAVHSGSGLVPTGLVTLTFAGPYTVPAYDEVFIDFLETDFGTAQSAAGAIRWTIAAVLDDLTLPLSSVSLRKTLQAESLTVTVPGVSLLAGIQSRRAQPLDMTITAYFSDGSSYDFDIVNFNIDTVSFNRNASVASVTIECSRDAVAAGYNAWSTAKATYLSKRGDTLRARVELEPLIKPRDTITLNGQAVIITETTMWIQPDQSGLEVAA